MGVESTAHGFSWRHGQHPAIESNVPLNPLFWLDGFCRLCAQPDLVEPLHRLMGLCIPQATDWKLLLTGCIQTGGDGLTSPRSSSGTEGEENCSGILAFQDSC